MITEDRAAVQGSTRERLITAGLNLFAEHGYRATTVGQIEQAAGLQPRRGALYRHFPSKEALLVAAVHRYLDSVQAGRDEFVNRPPGDVRTEAVLVGHWVLAELDAQRQISHLLEREGHRIPRQRDLFRAQVSDPGYRAMAELLKRWRGGADDTDLDALAVAVLGAIVNFRRSTWTFGAPPLDRTDEEFVQAWADQCAHLTRH
ncbi:MAG: TetR family transcriptional regulator [Streptosporangiales bacterium]|nr:TetR family transcriptional regulator [Streptosporangiales bacterium]